MHSTCPDPSAAASAAGSGCHRRPRCGSMHRAAVRTLRPQPKGRRRQDHRHARPGLGRRRRRSPGPGRRPRSAGVEHVGARITTRSTIDVLDRRRPRPSAGARQGDRAPQLGRLESTLVPARPRPAGPRGRHSRNACARRCGAGRGRLRRRPRSTARRRWAASTLSGSDRRRPRPDRRRARRRSGCAASAASPTPIDEVWDEHNPDLELAGVIVNRVPAVQQRGRAALSTSWPGSSGAARSGSRPIPQRVIVNQAIGERRPIHGYGSRGGRRQRGVRRAVGEAARLRARDRQPSRRRRRRRSARRPPRPSNVRPARPSTRRVSPSPTQLGPPAVGEAGVGVAAQQRHQVGAGGQQRGVDALRRGRPG